MDKVQDKIIQIVTRTIAIEDGREIESVTLGLSGNGVLYALCIKKGEQVWDKVCNSPKRKEHE